MSVHHISSANDLKELISAHSDTTLVINFHTDWSAQSKILNEQFNCHSQDPILQALVFAHCHAEIHSDISNEYNVDRVPTILFLMQSKVVDRLNGFNPKVLKRKLLHHGSKQYQSTYHLNATSSALRVRMRALFKSTDMILFVNCFHSSLTWEFYTLLDAMCARYEVFNVRFDTAVEEYLKKCWNITSFPQLFLFGHCIGDFEEVRNIKINSVCGKYFKKAIEVITETENCGTDPMEFARFRLKKLLKEKDIVVFLEHDELQRTRCVLDILSSIGLSLTVCNVRHDKHLRQQVQHLSNWSTFPQVFAHEKFVGNLDIIEQLYHDKQLLSVLKFVGCKA